MNQTLCTFLLACAALSLAAAPDPVRQAREQLALVKPDAARRALADLKGNPKYDYAKNAAAVEALLVKIDQVRNDLEKGDDAAKAAAVQLVEGYRKAMLANPVLDFDQILCVHRKINGPRGAFGGRGSGMTGLNAENHMVAPRTGFENEIVVLSDLRGEPKTRILYKPADKTSIVRDLDLDFDASRILFTGYKGTNNLFGVYEIVVKSPPMAALSAPSGLSAPSALSKHSREATLRGEAPLNNLTPTLVSPEDGKYDIHWWDACYLPNKDQVIMLGTGVFQYLPCEDGNMPMAVAYRVDRKTGEVRQLTYEQDSDYTPTITHDGRVLYTRWEYSDQPHYWSRVLMTMNPDGVGQLSVWGSNSFVPTFFYCARTVPGDPHLITMIGGGHHDRAEVGRFFQIDPTLARAYPFRYDPPDRDWGPARHTLRIPTVVYPKEKTGMVHEFPGWGKDVEGDMADPYTMNQFARGKYYFSHPWPLDAKYNLATVKAAPDALMGLYLVDVFDNVTRIAEADDGLYVEAIPFVPRKRPPIIPDRSDLSKKTCSVHVADIYNGPGLKGIPRGTVKKMRLFSYHYAYHNTGGHSMTGQVRGRGAPYNERVESSWDVKRILGTVDIEADGSCCFEMPCNTPISVRREGTGRAAHAQLDRGHAGRARVVHGLPRGQPLFRAHEAHDRGREVLQGADSADQAHRFRRDASVGLRERDVARGAEVLPFLPRRSREGAGREAGPGRQRREGPREALRPPPRDERRAARLLDAPSVHPPSRSRERGDDAAADGLPRVNEPARADAPQGAPRREDGAGGLPQDLRVDRPQRAVPRQVESARDPRSREGPFREGGDS